MFIKEEAVDKGFFDVIVLGGGVAGVSAAVTAARLGKHVLLIEKSVKLGGLATLGLINFFVPMCNGRGKQIIFGMAEELAQLSCRYGYGSPPDIFQNGRIPADILAELSRKHQAPPRYMFRFSTEFFALALMELCVKSGVELMLDTSFSCPVFAEDRPGKLRGVVVQNKSGRSFYSARMFVDTTGDGDVLHRAGVPTYKRGNYHTYIGAAVSLDSCRTALEKNNIQHAIFSVSGGHANLYGGGHPENTSLYDGTDGEEVSRYLISNQLELLEKLKRQPRQERDIVTLPGMPQFRTTRCIAGDVTLRESDAYCHFDDSIGAICDFDRRDYLFEIPFGTLVRKGVDNLITAGRSASAEGYAWDVIRVIPPAIITGQAAGVACAHALDENRPVWEINIHSLQEELQLENVQLHFDDADIPDVSYDIHENNDD